MSTIRRHGVAFHLVPTLGERLWLEVIRESDGAVLVSEEFKGEGDDDLAPAVEEWFGHIVLERVTEIDVSACRNCENRRRPDPWDEDGTIRRGHVIEWEFDLCISCATQLEQAVPWMRGYLEERYVVSDDEP